MEAVKAKRNFFSWFKYMWITHPLFSTAVALVVMIVLQTIAITVGQSYESFWDWGAVWLRNWINILRNNASVGIIALGMTFVIISGGIDLAVGSTLVAVGAVVMVIIDGGPTGILKGMGIEGLPVFVLAIVAALLFGGLLGQFSGVLVTNGKLPPFIATLGVMKICRSVTQQFMQGYTPQVPKGFLNISNLEFGPYMLMPIIYWGLLAFVLHKVSTRTAFGRHVFAVGSNERTAMLSGINVSKVKRHVYALIGVMVGIAAILQVSRIGSMDYANAGSGYEMDAIAAVIVGGTSMSGGKGSIAGTVIGMLIIGVMNNLLNLMGVPPFLREACKGVIVIGAVLLQRKDKN